MTDFVWPNVHVKGEIARARQEWLIANGAGAYASSTVALMHTRRYHGLLVAALEPPRRRSVIVSHIDTTLHFDDKDISLATHQFPGEDPREGYQFLSHFMQDPLPRWVYRVEGAELEQKLALVRGKNAIVLRYAWSGDAPLSMQLRPLLALRGHHALVREHGAMIQRVEMRANEVSVRPVKALPRVVFRHRGVFVGSPDWWRKFEYLDEQARGLDFQEDLWCPGVFRLSVQPGEPQYLVIGLDSIPEELGDTLMESSASFLRACDPGPERAWPVRFLSVAANVFRADLAPQPAIIAGYPWFEVWGRHSLAALSGLYLATGMVEEAKRIITGHTIHMRNGLVPNRMPDDGRPPEYHSVDASLLMLSVGRLVAERLDPGDPFIEDTLLPALISVFDAFCHGTVDGIHVTHEGLLAAGSQGTSLTWMDARVNGYPVTSRAGVPVELQAYWSKGCDDLAWFAERAGNHDLARRARDMCLAARSGFHARFWCETTSYPYDVVSEWAEGPDAWQDPSIRPNALMALAMDPELFTREQSEAILARVERELMTAAGVRTLSPQEPAYRGLYAGSIRERDGAYHQGTVWPFLLGPFSRAVRHVYPDDTDRRGRLRALIEGLLNNQLALGQVAEVYDGDPPHRPDGCVGFAASVGELLRVFVDDLGM